MASHPLSPGEGHTVGAERGRLLGPQPRSAFSPGRSRGLGRPVRSTCQKAGHLALEDLAALTPGGRGQRTPRTAPPPGHPSAGEAQARNPDSAGRHRPQREKLGPSTDGPLPTLLWGLQSSTSGASQPTGPLPLAARGQRAGRRPHGQHSGPGGDGAV